MLLRHFELLYEGKIAASDLKSHHLAVDKWK